MNGDLYNIPPNTRDVMLGEGNLGATLQYSRGLAGQAGGVVPQSSSYQLFGLALMDLLKRFQGLGTKPFLEAELKGREEQAGRIMAPAEAGMPPSLQRAARGAEAGAVEPQITGAKEMGRTFTEQLAGFADALSQARAIGTWMEESEMNKQKQAIDLITKFPSAIQRLSKDQKNLIAKQAGVSSEFIDMIEPEVGEAKIISRKEGIFKINPITGALTPLYTAPTAFVMTPSTMKALDASKDAKSKLGDLKTAISYLENGAVKVGVVSGRRLEAGQKYGVPKLTPAELDFMSKFGRIRAKELFEVGGKVLTPYEIRELERYIPTLTQSQEAVITNLKNMYNKLLEIYQNEVNKLKLQVGAETSETTEEVTPEEEIE